MKEQNETYDDSAAELVQLVICQLSKEEFGIDISRVKEIIRIPEITKIPQVPHYIEGIINLRGGIVPVINLATRFGLSHEGTDDNSRIVVLEIGNLVVGMIVDSVTEVLRMSKENIESAPEVIRSGVSEKYIRGVGKVEERLLILLDIDEIFQEEKRLELNNIEDAGAIPA